jgi:hypothetical protein
MFPISNFSPFVPYYIKVLANLLSNPMASGGDSSDGIGWPYVAFDIDPRVVKVSSVSEHCEWLFQCLLVSRQDNKCFL